MKKYQIAPKMIVPPHSFYATARINADDERDVHKQTGLHRIRYSPVLIS